MSIEPRIEAVFVHVSDMARAIQWYSELLDLPPVLPSHEGLIYDLPLPGETGIVLDGHAHARGQVVNRQGAQLLFQTDDLEKVIGFAKSHGVNVTEPEDIGSVTVLYLEDPDGNLMCVKSPNA